MTPDQIHKKLHEGVEHDLYRYVRLRKLVDGGERETVLPWNGNRGPDDVTKRIDQCFHKISLEPGTYIIEAKALSGARWSDEFEIKHRKDFKPPQMGSEPAKAMSDDHITAYQFPEPSISIEKYEDLLEENSQLRIDLAMKNHELELMQKYMQPVKQLADQQAHPPNPWATLATKLADGLGEALPRLAEVLGQELDERRKKKEPTPQQQQQQSFKQAVAYFRELIARDEKQADEELDQIEEQNPILYHQLGKALGFIPTQHNQAANGEGTNQAAGEPT